jgi:hypothetical protein
MATKRAHVDKTTTVAAEPAAAWAVLADFGAISSWVPLIQHSCILSPHADGPGAVRRVQIARQTLVERVIEWNPPHRLSYAIDGLPPIVGSARNTWTLSPGTDGSTVVTLTTEIDTGRNPVKSLVASKVLERMSTASELMLAGLAAAVAPPTDPTGEPENEHTGLDQPAPAHPVQTEESP